MTERNELLIAVAVVSFSLGVIAGALALSWRT